MGTQKECASGRGMGGRKKECAGGGGGGGGDDLKSIFGIVCKGGEFLTQFWRHGGIECDRCQKEENLIALDWSTVRERGSNLVFYTQSNQYSYIRLSKRKRCEAKLPWSGIHSEKAREMLAGDESEKNLACGGWTLDLDHDLLPRNFKITFAWLLGGS